MKVTIKCDNYNDYMKLKRMLTADDLYSILWDIQNKIRIWYKYGAGPDEVLKDIKDLIVENVNFEFYK